MPRAHSLSRQRRLGGEAAPAHVLVDADERRRDHRGRDLRPRRSRRRCRWSTIPACWTRWPGWSSGRCRCSAASTKPTWTCRRRCRQVSMRVNQRYFAFRNPRRLGGALFRLRRQYRARRRRRDLDRRQRARAARPLRRCAALLGSRPQGARWNRACRCWTTSPSMRSSAARASACAGWSVWPRRSLLWSAPALPWRATPRGWPRPTSSPAWSASSPNCRA